MLGKPLGEVLATTPYLTNLCWEQLTTGRSRLPAHDQVDTLVRAGDGGGDGDCLVCHWAGEGLSPA